MDVMDTMDIWEWAWKLYDAALRTPPDCEHNRIWRAYIAECRKIQKAMMSERNKELKGRQNEMATTRTKPAARIVTVAAISEMDQNTFVKHFNARHKDGLAEMTKLAEDIDFATWQLYVSFHYRTHHTKAAGKLGHRHEKDDPSFAIDRAIECLIENRNFGWKELAGIRGLIAVFPDGKIATRIEGKVKHHDTVESATDRLLGD